MPDKSAIDADVCIVGAGAAGIGIAREFINTPTQVAVLEGGGLEFDQRTQSLYEGENIGLETFPVDANRLRFFGGTTNHWAGHSRTLDAIDFEQLDALPMSGWPISKADLEPYYRRAEYVCELSSVDDQDIDGLTSRLKLAALELDVTRLQSVVYKQSPPTRFGHVYRDELERAANVRVYLNANALELQCNVEGTVVEGVDVACIDGPRLRARANMFVLATGGIENARILLLSNKPNPAGLGNASDLVGRYFQDHILLRPAAEIIFSKMGVDLSLYHELSPLEGGDVFSVLAPSEGLIRSEGIGNFRLHIIRPQRMSALGEGSLRAIKSAVRERRFASARAHLRNIMSDLDGIAELTYKCIANAPIPDENHVLAAQLHLVLQPMPDPDSRVTLSGTRDLLGQRRVAVNWQVRERDLANARRAVELAALEVGRLGLGRAFAAILDDASRWPSNLEAGRHHCGTTRMSTDPSNGVVDGDCLVHGVSNLYVAGSSVFPTIGYANPTLTIVALALRIADTIKRRLNF